MLNIECPAVHCVKHDRTVRRMKEWLGPFRFACGQLHSGLLVVIIHF